MTYPAPDDGVKPGSPWLLLLAVVAIVAVVIGLGAGILAAITVLTS